MEDLVVVVISDHPRPTTVVEVCLVSLLPF